MPKVQRNVLDITAIGKVIDQEIKIISIQAIASADNSACVITDRYGTEIARFETDITNHRTYSPVYLDGMQVEGIVCGVYTNMKKVLIHYR